MKIIEEFGRWSLEKGAVGYNVIAEFMMGMVFANIVLGESEVSPMTMARNIGFIIKNVPTAAKKADAHLARVIDKAAGIGYTGYIGHARGALGRIHQAKGKKDKARECFSEAARIFEECQAHTLLQQARDELNTVV